MAIESIGDLLVAVARDRREWDEGAPAWFRGEPLCQPPQTQLLPKLFRPRKDGRSTLVQSENTMLQLFRMRAALFSDRPVPDRGHTDQWLFLAQHSRLPTRLLDWTESALIALWFALQETNPVLWMLNPLELNRLSVSESEKKKPPSLFGLTWVSRPRRINIGSESINAAWEARPSKVELPVAVIPTYVHPRMGAQRSCFTVHGRTERPLNELAPDVVMRYDIEPSVVKWLRNDLGMLGIRQASAFPDLDGLSSEIASLY